ncbi:TPA: hypothetical protein HA259_03590 [Thermoplasmata archaeon]|nr:hypothetical protein [Thermoplasmata archaeon]
MRRLAVPLAINGLSHSGQNVMRKTRKLKASGIDVESQRLLSKLAENRSRIEQLESDFWEYADVDCADIVDEIEYLRANIELGLVEIAGGLDEIRSSEEILAEVMA